MTPNPQTATLRVMRMNLTETETTMSQECLRDCPEADISEILTLNSIITLRMLIQKN